MHTNHSDQQGKKERNFLARLLTSARFINLLKTVILILLILLMAAALIWFVPWIPKLNDPEQLHYFREKLDSFAPYSWLILFGVQLLQVFVAIIPGEPFELLAGVFCGTFGGLLLCLAGVLVGTVAIYYLVRWLGRSFIERMFEKEKVRNFKLLNNPRNLELLLFLLFFVPGTPKDLLTYMAPLTPVKPLHFFLIATLARIPSVFTSTYAGAHLEQGDFMGAVVMYAVAAAMGIGGLIFYHWFSDKRAAKKNKTTKENE